MAKLRSLFAILVMISACNAQICNVTLRTDLPAREPVYLKVRNGQARLWAPDGSSLIWYSNQDDTVLLCSGDKNALSPTKSVSNRIACVSDKTFLVQGITFSSQQLECLMTITGDVFETEQSCGKDSVLLYVGFASQTYGFIPYIQSCMNMTQASVRWTRHILPGSAIDGAMTDPMSKTWKASGMPRTVKPDTSYTQSSQLMRLTELLGSARQASRYVIPGTSQYMERGHMTPNADGIFRSWRSATYYFINAVPKWKVINNGNWARVERVVRNVAAHLAEDFVVIQGTHEILMLPHVDGKSQIPITLEANGIEVPRWVWKIIKLPKLKQGIAFVTYNNPYEMPQDFICTDICSLTGWNQAAYSEFSKGFTYCCHPNELLRKVRTASPEGKVKSLLMYPLPHNQKL